MVRWNQHHFCVKMSSYHHLHFYQHHHHCSSCCKECLSSSSFTALCFDDHATGCENKNQVWCQKHGGVKDFLDGSNVHQMELAPEIFLHNKKPDQKSDIWGLGKLSMLEIDWNLIC